MASARQKTNNEYFSIIATGLLYTYCCAVIVELKVFEEDVSTIEQNKTRE